MNADLEAARLSVTYAQQALRRGDRRAARRWAQKAAALAPELEEPWLILASLAAPQASVTYLERALQVNPQSARAREGMRWAQERLQRLNLHQDSSSVEQPQPLKKPTAADETKGRASPRSSDSILAAPEERGDDSAQVTQPIGTTARASSAPSVNESVDATQPQVRGGGRNSIPTTAPTSGPLPAKSVAKYRWSLLPLFIVTICLTAAWAFWPASASSALDLLIEPQSTPTILGAAAEMEKPTYTPSPTATFTPTPTFTLTPTPTETSTPSPTDTPAQFVPAGIACAYFGDDNDDRWIDVDLSEQRLYACEGDTVVGNFLVSTGVGQFPTVTGQFHIYIKLESTTMSGVGYYLEKVPYTMYFYYDYGIHGTYWHSNFGTPMSHGCINMYTPDAEWLFNWASVGTLVNVHY